MDPDAADFSDVLLGLVRRHGSGDEGHGFDSKPAVGAAGLRLVVLRSARSGIMASSGLWQSSKTFSQQAFF